MKKRTLYILDDPSRDKHVHDYVLEGLRERGICPVICYFWRNSKYISRYGDRGFLTAYLSQGPKSRTGFNPLTLWKLLFLIRSLDIGLLHVQRHRLMIYCALASRLTGVPVVYTVRLTSILRNRKRRVAFRLASRRISRIICVSRDVARSLREASGIESLPLEIIYNGIDVNQYDISSPGKAELRRRYGLPEHAFIYGIVARLRKAKDHRTLIKAFSRFILSDSANAYLVIVGDGPLESELKSLARDCDAGERILFWGRLEPSEVPYMLKTFDVFVHPSFREGLPMAILEAMSAKLPVIGNECPPIVEILGPGGQFGFLCKSRDVESMENTLKKVYYMEKDQRAQMGEAGYRRVIEEFSKEKMVNKTINVYEEILKTMPER